MKLSQIEFIDDGGNTDPLNIAIDADGYIVDQTTQQALALSSVTPFGQKVAAQLGEKPHPAHNNMAYRPATARRATAPANNPLLKDATARAEAPAPGQIAGTNVLPPASKVIDGIKKLPPRLQQEILAGLQSSLEKDAASRVGYRGENSQPQRVNPEPIQ